MRHEMALRERVASQDEAHRIALTAATTTTGSGSSSSSRSGERQRFQQELEALHGVIGEREAWGRHVQAERDELERQLEMQTRRLDDAFTEIKHLTKEREAMAEEMEALRARLRSRPRAVAHVQLQIKDAPRLSDAVLQAIVRRVAKRQQWNLPDESLSIQREESGNWHITLALDARIADPQHHLQQEFERRHIAVLGTPPLQFSEA